MEHLRSSKHHIIMWVCLVAFLILVGLQGCAPKNLSKSDKVIYTTVKTLQVAKDFRVLGLQTAGKLHSAGKIDDKLAREIIVIANDLQASINAISLLLETYDKTRGPDDKKALDAQVEVYMGLYGQFTEIIMPYLIKRIGD